MATVCGSILVAAILANLLIVGPAARAASIPQMKAGALDGHTISLPQDLPAATVLILGFSRQSADATTAWEKPVRARFLHSPGIAFYDIAMLAQVPHFARSFVIGRVRKAVPDVLKPNFLVLTDHEPEWKQIAQYDPKQEDAAYVLLVDHAGTVRWSSRAAFTVTLLDQLANVAQELVGN